MSLPSEDDQPSTINCGPDGHSSGSWKRLVGNEVCDAEAFREALLHVNTWASGLDLSKDSALFRRHRRDASYGRLRAGARAWNAWASAMLRLREYLEKHDLWAPINGTGYLGPGHFQDAIPQSENEETRLWLMLSYADFRGKMFGPSPMFSHFHFPSVADFRPLGKKPTVFPEGASFYAAVFHDHGLFEQTHFLETGVTFEEAEFKRDANFQCAVFDGETEFIASKIIGSVTFDRAEVRDFSSFVECIFSKTAMFNDTQFSREVIFDRACFKGQVLFEQTSFAEPASFAQASFESTCYFYSCRWRHGAGFVGARFQNNAYFSPPPEETGKHKPSTFGGPMSFSQSAFEAYATFAEVTFLDEADFSAIQAKSAFSLVGTTFSQIPDFTQSDFKQPPDLDHAIFKTEASILRDRSDLSAHIFGRATSPAMSDLPRRFRALKRIAIQGRDYSRELEFHAGEMKSRRRTFDKALGRNAGSFWFGLLYQITSDFGRSIWRPLFWWLVAGISFTFLYRTAAVAGDDPCSRWGSAIYLSLRKGFSLPNLEASEKLKRAYGCLYGYGTPADGAPVSNPSLPDYVELATVVQSVSSGVLIFLLALALRNRFRIG